jgi:hypothetical protein
MLSLVVDAFVAIDIRTMAVVDEGRGLADLLLIAAFDVMWVSSGTVNLVYWPIGSMLIVGIAKEHVESFALEGSAIAGSGDLELFLPTQW